MESWIGNWKCKGTMLFRKASMSCFVETKLLCVDMKQDRVDKAIEKDFICWHARDRFSA